jgi:hypothetical protein
MAAHNRSPKLGSGPVFEVVRLSEAAKMVVSSINRPPGVGSIAVEHF